MIIYITFLLFTFGNKNHLLLSNMAEFHSHLVRLPRMNLNQRWMTQYARKVQLNKNANLVRFKPKNVAVITLLLQVFFIGQADQKPLKSRPRPYMPKALDQQLDDGGLIVVTVSLHVT